MLSAYSWVHSHLESRQYPNSVFFALPVQWTKFVNAVVRLNAFIWPRALMLSQGHCHPRIVATLVEQAQKLTLSSRAFYNSVFGRFAKTITSMFGYDMVLPMNTGAEAVETSIKLARKWAYMKKGVKQGKAIVLSAKDNFHGRTLGVIRWVQIVNYFLFFWTDTPNCPMFRGPDPVFLFYSCQTSADKCLFTDTPRVAWAPTRNHDATLDLISRALDQRTLITVKLSTSVME